MSKYKLFGLGFAHYNGEQSYFDDLIHTALINRVVYFEACSFYMNYECEFSLTNTLNDYTSRDKYVLANKLCNEICEKNFEGDLEKYFNSQLQNCNTNYFDYYLIQYVDGKYFDSDKHPNDLFISQYNFLLKKKQEGKIKNIGFVYHGYPEYFENCFLEFDWDCVQFSLNYYKWKFGYAKNLYEIATQYKVPIIAMEPLAMGLLTQSPKIINAAYNFLMTLSNVKIILNGTTSLSHLNNNLNMLISYIQFSKSDLDLLNSVVDNLCYSCAGCKNCVIQCPKQIDLKQLITNFNNKSTSKEAKEKYYQYFEPFLKENNIFCRSCNICSRQCENCIDFQQLFWNEIFPLRI